MKYQIALRKILLNDAVRMKALSDVKTLRLSDCWIGAGFVRDAVWNHLHGYGQQPISGDIDVVWFDKERCCSAQDHHLEVKLSQLDASFNWSVKNQVRMNQRNGDIPYFSTEDAIKYWPETATSVAVRLDSMNKIQIIAPYGLDDLFQLCIRPTPRFESEKLDIFRQRVAQKSWLERYPLLEIITPT